MSEADWLSCDEPWRMLRALNPPLGSRKLRLYQVACCRRIWDRLTDPNSREAVEVAEAFADGQATMAELKEAYLWAQVAFDREFRDNHGEPSRHALPMILSLGASCTYAEEGVA
jgi:hypothetical protein